MDECRERNKKPGGEVAYAHAGFLIFNLVSSFRSAGAADGAACSDWRITINGNFQRANRWRRGAADLCHPSQYGCIEVTGTATITNTDRDVFKNHEISSVSKGFSIHATLFHRPIAMLALEIVHSILTPCVLAE
jgi:hypothetical protein